MDKPQEMSKALADVWAERRRQISEEDWSEDHDDHHDTGELARAAACYALSAAPTYAADVSSVEGIVRRHWPWDWNWWKPGDVRRMLVKAAALLLAEIERIDRAALKANTDQEAM